MLLNQMGRDKALAGMQVFIKAYQGNPDHPVLQDFLASMRPLAVDGAAFDAFTHQWFYEVVIAGVSVAGRQKNQARRELGSDRSARERRVGRDAG